MLNLRIPRAALPIGIDLGASGARLMQVRRTSAGLFVNAAARIDMDLDRQDDDASLRRLAGLSAARIELGKFSGRKCVLSLDDRMLRVRSIRTPRMTDDETTAALSIDGAERLGISGAAQFGWIRAGDIAQGDEAHQELILFGAETSEVERVVGAFIDVGLTPVGVEPGFMACARSMSMKHRRDSDRGSVRLVADIGRDSTGLLVLRGDVVAFYKRIEWGGRMLDQAASERLGLDLETVSEIRRERQRGGASIDERADRAIFDAVRPMLDDLANEITMCVRYYMVTFRGERPAFAALVGGDANEPHLCDAVAKATGLDTRIGQPLESLRTEGASFIGADRREGLSQWAVAAGLSLRADVAPAVRLTKPGAARRAA